MMKVFSLALMAMLADSSVRAVEKGDWPCKQVRVPTLSAATFWPEDVSAQGEMWRDDPAIRALVERLVSRRTPEEEFAGIVGGYVASVASTERPKQLANVFAGSFIELNRLRGDIIAGIERYTRAQRTVAERLRTDRAEVDTLLGVSARTPDQQTRLQALQDKISWETRIYREREGSLTYICETPVLLEQRIFGISRALQAAAQ